MNEIDEGRTREAFAHAAGFSADRLATSLGILASVLLLSWFIWTLWSGFRGLRKKRVDKEVFRRMVFRSALIYLVLQFLLFYGVSA